MPAQVKKEGAGPQSCRLSYSKKAYMFSGASFAGIGPVNSKEEANS